MKIRHLLLTLIAAISLSSCDKTSYQPKELDPNTTYDSVYLIMGQSNASGVSPHSFLKDSNPDIYTKYVEGNSKVLISYDTDNRIEKNFVTTKFGYGNTDEFFGPEIGIAETISQTEESSYIIKATFSGSCLMTQYVDKNGGKHELYNRFIDFIKGQLNALTSSGKNPRVKGVFWMQGESDSFLEYKNQYQKAEQHFYEYLRHDLNDWIYEYFNFVDAYICTTSKTWPDAEVINECKEHFANANEHCYCIKTNGEDDNAINLTIKSQTGEGDDVAHYDSKSMLLLGLTAGSYLLK